MLRHGGGRLPQHPLHGHGQENGRSRRLQSRDHFRLVSRRFRRPQTERRQVKDSFDYGGLIYFDFT